MHVRGDELRDLKGILDHNHLVRRLHIRIIKHGPKESRISFNLPLELLWARIALNKSRL